MTLRVYPRPELTAHLHEKYGLPTEPFIGPLTGRNVIEARLLGIDTGTRTWTLRPESGALGDWIREKGQKAWLRALLIDDPVGTARWFADAWRDESGAEAVGFIRIYLGLDWRFNEPDNLVAIAATGAGREYGFFGFDPLVALRAGLRWLGFGAVVPVLLYAGLGIAVSRTRFASHWLPLASSALLVSLPLFFISYFGDAMEVERHVGPAVILNCLAALLLLASLPGVPRAARKETDEPGPGRSRREAPGDSNDSRSAAGGALQRLAPCLGLDSIARLLIKSDY